MKNQRYIVLTFLVLAAFMGMAVRGLGSPLLASFEVGDPLVGGLVTVTSLAGVLSGIGIFFFLLRHIPSVTFTDEVVTELRKVFWPTRDETVRATAVVVATTLFIALCLAFYDFVWARVTSTFLFTEG